MNLIAQSVFELSHRENVHDDNDHKDDTHSRWIIVRDGENFVVDKKRFSTYFNFFQFIYSLSIPFLSWENSNPEEYNPRTLRPFRPQPSQQGEEDVNSRNIPQSCGLRIEGWWETKRSSCPPSSSRGGPAQRYQSIIILCDFCKLSLSFERRLKYPKVIVIALSCSCH